ncbi:MAG: SEL1-like repeat protein [Massilia sp.]
MKTYRRLSVQLALMLAALCAAGVTQGQTPGAPAEPAAAPVTAPSLPANSIVVTGKRFDPTDRTATFAARSKVLSRNRGSSCNYMSRFSPDMDDVTLNYMQDVDNAGLSSNLEILRENSPGGDASTDRAHLSSSRMDTAGRGSSERRAAGGCKAADLRFAAGRAHIARKDKTLDDAFASFDSKDYPKALEQFKISYEKMGYDGAGMMVGRMYLYGIGTEPDTAQAVYWLKKVAEDRFDPVTDRLKFYPRSPEFTTPRAEATMNLARIYLVGWGTDKKPAEARKWLEKAVEIGFVPAHVTLGLACLNGYGGSKDAPKALRLFKEAAEQGYRPAQFHLAQLYYHGDTGVPKDLKTAGAWFVTAGKAGDARALYAVGRMYDLGEGIPVDQPRAIVYYKEAAVYKNPSAENALATYFYSGEIVGKDLAIARKWFNLAALHGQADAMFNLGAMCARGEGGEKDMANAYVWLVRAKEAGHENAAAALKLVEPQLSTEDRSKADLALKPKAARQS